MSRWFAGAVLLLADPDYKHSRASDYEGLTANDLWVLAAAASFAIEELAVGRLPECVASIASISRRTRLSRETVKRCLPRLEAAGRISRAGWARRDGGKSTVRWRIHGLNEDAPSQVSTPEGSDRPTTARAAVDGEDAPSQVNALEGSDRPTTARTTSGSHRPTIGVSQTHNPSDSSRPQGRDEEEDRSSAPRTASADAAATAAPHDDEPTAHLAEIMSGLGLDRTQAEAWISRKLAGAIAPVRNETAFLRRCLAAELEQRAAPARPAAEKPAKEGKGSRSEARTAEAQQPARRPRPHHTVRRGTEAAVLAASRGGEAHEVIAERENVTVEAVDKHRRSADFLDAVKAAKAGEPCDVAAEKFGVDVAEVERRHGLWLRSQALDALRAGSSIGEVCEQFGESVEDVLAWARDADAREARHARAKRTTAPKPLAPLIDLAGTASAASSATGELGTTRAGPDPEQPDPLAELYAPALALAVAGAVYAPGPDPARPWRTTAGRRPWGSVA